MEGMSCRVSENHMTTSLVQKLETKCRGKGFLSHFEFSLLIYNLFYWPGLIHSFIFWAMVLDCFSSVDSNCTCKQL